MRDPRPCAIFIMAWGSNWGLQVFPVIKIKIKHIKRCTACEDRRRIGFVRVEENSKTPYLSPMAMIKMARGLGSPMYICELSTVYFVY